MVKIHGTRVENVTAILAGFVSLVPLEPTSVLLTGDKVTDLGALQIPKLVICVVVLGVGFVARFAATLSSPHSLRLKGEVFQRLRFATCAADFRHWSNGAHRGSRTRTVRVLNSVPLPIGLREQKVAGPSP